MGALYSWGPCVSKAETAALLRGFGFSYLEIARELYPRDYELYKKTRDPRLYTRLKMRVRRLIKYWEEERNCRDCTPSNGESVYHSDMFTATGVRDPLKHSNPQVVNHPRTRKAGKSGFDRQVIEYEQLLYHYYKKYMEKYDPTGALWGTIKWLHGRVFKRYYEEYKDRKVNVYVNRKPSSVARAYVYALLSTTALLHGLLHLRMEVERGVGEIDRDVVSRVIALVFDAVL